jgi:transposase
MAARWIGKLVERLTGQRYCESGVWRLLRRLGLSSRRPSTLKIVPAEAGGMACEGGDPAR